MQHVIDDLFPLRWNSYHFFNMCFNENWSLCCVNNVLNGTHGEKYHIRVDVLSSILVYIAETLIPKLGMQPKTNFNYFLWNFRLCRNWTDAFSRDAMPSYQLGCLLKWWVSSASDGLLYISELKCDFNEYLLVFHVEFLFQIRFYFLGHWFWFAHHISIFLFYH